MSKFFQLPPLRLNLTKARQLRIYDALASCSGDGISEQMRHLMDLGARTLLKEKGIDPNYYNELVKVQSFEEVATVPVVNTVEDKVVPAEKKKRNVKISKGSELVSKSLVEKFKGKK